MNKENMRVLAMGLPHLELSHTLWCKRSKWMGMLLIPSPCSSWSIVLSPLYSLIPINPQSWFALLNTEQISFFPHHCWHWCWAGDTSSHYFITSLLIAGFVPCPQRELKTQIWSHHLLLSNLTMSPHRFQGGSHFLNSRQGLPWMAWPPSTSAASALTRPSPVPQFMFQLLLELLLLLTQTVLPHTPDLC